MFTYSINTVERHKILCFSCQNVSYKTRPFHREKKNDQLCDSGHFPIQKDEKISPSKSSAK